MKNDSSKNLILYPDKYDVSNHVKIIQILIMETIVAIKTVFKRELMKVSVKLLKLSKVNVLGNIDGYSQSAERDHINDMVIDKIENNWKDAEIPNRKFSK